MEPLNSPPDRDPKEIVFERLLQVFLASALKVFTAKELSALKAQPLASQKIRYLLPLFKIEHYAETTNLLTYVAGAGMIELVERLVPVSHPKRDASVAFRLAALNGHVDVVRFLLPHSEPKRKKSQALMHSVLSGNETLVELLYPVSSPDDVLKSFQKSPNNPEQALRIKMFQDRVKADQEKIFLRKNIAKKQKSMPRRKI